jgi:hypothetical protein
MLIPHSASTDRATGAVRMHPATADFKRETTDSGHSRSVLENARIVRPAAALEGV